MDLSPSGEIPPEDGGLLVLMDSVWQEINRRVVMEHLLDMECSEDLDELSWLYDQLLERVSHVYRMNLDRIDPVEYRQRMEELKK